jgi:hypothetical protein
MTSQSIRTSRYPGQAQGELRNIREEQLALCEEVAETIIGTVTARTI